MMAKARILVAEDEVIIGKDIEHRLNALGYEVVALVASAEAAVQQTEEKRPDLVLMDIRLGEGSDGIEAAEAIRRRCDVAVVYLTAYADDQTLARAKATEPFGYLLKPFNGRELGITIDIALQKHRSGLAFKAWVATTLRCIDDAVMALDTAGRVTLLNPVAERLTGWTSAVAIGEDVTAVFPITSEPAQIVSEHPVKRALREKSIAPHSTQAKLIQGKSGRQIRIEYTTVPIRNAHGTIAKGVVVFRDISERDETEEQLREYRDRWETSAHEQTIARSKGELALRRERAHHTHTKKDLETKTTALKELLHQITLQKEAIGDQVIANVDTLVMPILKRLKVRSTTHERQYVELLERNLKELTGPFGSRISKKLFGLTSRELEVCNMLKSGLTSKEISRLLHIEPSTVETHRNNIRRKLGIRSKQIHTATYLKSL